MQYSEKKVAHIKWDEENDIMHVLFNNIWKQITKYKNIRLSTKLNFFFHPSFEKIGKNRLLPKSNYIKNYIYNLQSNLTQYNFPKKKIKVYFNYIWGWFLVAYTCGCKNPNFEAHKKLKT